MTHEQIIKRIFAERDKQGITNYKLSQLTDIHKTTLTRIESGEDVKISTLLKISNALKLKLKVE